MVIVAKFLQHYKYLYIFLLHLYSHIRIIILKLQNSLFPMEKRSITGRDILRMDGLLPPTRRLPVCDAVTSPDKTKEKKWSIGGFLKRISSIRDYDSSSNDEEMVYCPRQPRTHTVFDRKSRNVILHPVEKQSDQDTKKKNSLSNDDIVKSVKASTVPRDCAYSRNSDGSLEGSSKKSRKSKLKARMEAKRDRICANSSSDEDTRRSCNSLTRYQNEHPTQSLQRNSFCNKKSRAARTERYMKRLSKDEGHRLPENLSGIQSKRSSLEFTDGNQQFIATEANELSQPRTQSQHFTTQSNSHTFPGHRSVENLRDSAVIVSSPQTKSFTDIRKHQMNQYITDLNQNNAYAKPNISTRNKNYVNHEEDNYILNSSVTNTNYRKPCDSTRNRQSANRNSSPPEPPPRDPRCRVFAYGCHSLSLNGKYRGTRYDDSPHAKVNNIQEAPRDPLKGLRSYESNNEISWCGSNKQYPRRPLSLTVPSTQSCNLSECTNNRHHSTGRHLSVPISNETETMKCQRRNDRNDQLSSSFSDYNPRVRGNKFTQNIHNNSSSTSDNPRARSPFRRIVPERSPNLSSEPFDGTTDTVKMDENQVRANEQDVAERKKSSKNLEDALSELEAIYNSLRLGDEDLLDRAERRSMEEFSLRRGNISNAVTLAPLDSPDRTKDDMAYRRMHPKERPTSLSEVVGQSALSNISYLMASPIMSRKDSVDGTVYSSNYPARRDEPDVTRDDVVYRSIHHANNTLKVVDPQPPFGIPVGPVTTATESDYLHTTPTKPEHPRSSYIPQCEPDIVTDDLAYRTLRKDANTTKNTGESKSGVRRDEETAFGTKKKRAVRSLSANLYGLINQDRIHLRREPSLQEIHDEMNDTLIDINSLPVPKDSFRRVVSDGELSDYDTRWRTENSIKNKTDINGNHSVTNLQRKNLRVYISPASMVQRLEKKKGDAETQNSAPSNASPPKALNNEFWRDCSPPRSNDSSNKDTESDFTAYSRLCQDLVNLIEGPNNAEEKPSEENLVESTKTESRQPGDDNKADESTVLHIQTLGGHYSEHKTANKEIVEKEEIERLTESIANPENEDVEKTEDKTFDFYLRVADENVKLIAEAFSSVADHLRDSRLSQKNSLTSHRSEIETDSTVPDTSTRSSVTFSQNDVNDDLSSSSKTSDDILETVPTEDATMTLERVQKEVVAEDISNSNPELDLSKAVHDLQIAAASLCEHGKDIEELEALLNKDTSDNVCVTTDAVIEEENSLTLDRNEESDEDNRKETVIPTEIELKTDENLDSEGESIECKTVCESYDIDVTRSTGMRISYATNLITVMITTYSMVLLACFLALLLATVAAS